jgi:branched-chain amino acid transport system ATP-binding protein
MAEGKIVAEGQPKSVMNDQAVVDAYLGARANIDLGDIENIEEVEQPPAATQAEGAEL